MTKTMMAIMLRKMTIKVSNLEERKKLKKINDDNDGEGNADENSADNTKVSITENISRIRLTTIMMLMMLMKMTIPKSAILTSSGEEQRMFSGFRSRWKKPFLQLRFPILMLYILCTCFTYYACYT